MATLRVGVYENWIFLVSHHPDYAICGTPFGRIVNALGSGASLACLAYSNSPSFFA